MINFIQSSLKKAFSSVIASFIIFIISVFFVSFLTNSIGALTIPIDRPMSLNSTNNNSDDVGVVFILKKLGVLTSQTDISLEINEISDAKIFSGIGSVQAIRNKASTVVNKRYVRIEGVKLPNNSRADYAVIGKNSGGKISGSVLVGQKKVTGCVFFTNFQFYIVCFCFFVVGGAVVGFLSYYQTILKQDNFM